ncbi:uncharacterized protein LOC117652043 [Thrips palmi]|uniref:Uncharacterized protein LOC117652043 n=1 Tax=Thrips palmi TaxID=161013 RepID=A0A6P9A3V3_THRPL|nr:uncharacterized protein LOC117652043 [Thrips palmi]
MKLGILTKCPVEGCDKSYKIVQSFTGHMSKCHWAKPVTNCPAPNHGESVDVLEENCAINSDLYLDDEGENEFLLDDGDLSEKVVLETMCQFFIKLEFELFLPATSVQYIASELGALQSQNSDIVEDRLRKKLKNCNVSNIDDIVSYVLKENPISKVQENLKSDYLRKETYKKSFTFVKPIPKTSRKKSFFYVPLKETVKALFSDKSTNFVLSPPKFSDVEDVLRDYTDGFVFQNNPFFINNPSALHFLLYQDAFEVVVPIGPAKKKYKMLAVYLLIGNIPVHLRSRVSSIQLVALCIENNFEHNAVYGPIVKDLQDLETKGVYISESVGTVKGGLVCVIGDNLGGHGLGGFVEQFSTSIYFCRFCHVERKMFNLEGGELVSCELRTKQSYIDCLEQKGARKKKIYKGIKFNSVFNKLKYFHVCDPGLSPCLAHDLFEGLAAYDLKLYIDYFVEKGWFTYAMLNDALEAFSLSSIDKRDRPIPVLEDQARCEVQMGRVVLILHDNQDGIFLLVEKVTTTFIPYLRVYEIGPKISYECVSVDDLASHQSLHVYSNDSHLYVKLKFGLVFDHLE